MKLLLGSRIVISSIFRGRLITEVELTQSCIPHTTRYRLWKSLLTFYGSFMTPEAEEWLAFQVATTYGLDKAPMLNVRVGKNNTHLISCVASDPISIQSGKLLMNLGNFLRHVMNTITVFKM